MPQAGPPSLAHATQAIVARAGLGWVIFIATTLAYWLLATEGRFNWFAPVLLAAGLWLWFFGVKDRRDFQAIDRLIRGENPRQGQWTALAGTARPIDPAEGDILACHFRSYDRLRGAGQSRPSYRLHFEGVYMVPFGIETAGTLVPVLGFPDLTHTGRDPLDNDILAAAKAAARRPPRWMPKALVRELAIAGRVTRLQDCVRYLDTDPSAEGKLDSKALRRGEAVCLFGLWRDGTLRATHRRAGGLPLYKGTPEAVHADLKDTAKGFLIFGAILIAAAAALALWSFL